jgi:hypothetical protein
VSEDMSLSEWVRQLLRAAWRDRQAGDQARKLDAVRAATRHSFPTGTSSRCWWRSSEARLPVPARHEAAEAQAREQGDRASGERVLGAEADALRATSGVLREVW